MRLTEVLKKSFLEGYGSVNIDFSTIVMCMLITVLVAMYIFMIYRLLNRSAFYNRNFNLALIALAVITAAVILTIQSNIVISLGMVGALSIVRFRTAVKDPMDLVFLFWSISIGIICGAGLYEVALVTSVAVTVCILVLDLLPVAKAPVMLVVNSSLPDGEAAVLEVVGRYARAYKVKSRNLSRDRLDLVVELRVRDESGLIKEVAGLEGMCSASLIAHDGEVTF